MNLQLISSEIQSENNFYSGFEQSYEKFKTLGDIVTEEDLDNAIAAQNLINLYPNSLLRAKKPNFPDLKISIKSAKSIDSGLEYDDFV